MFYCAFILLLIPFNLASGIFNRRSMNFVNHHRHSPMGCLCEDASLCGPIPHTKGNVRLAYSTDPSNWKYYNLSKLTEIAVWFDVSRLEPEMVCMAHKNNIQLHLAGFFGNETFLNQSLQEIWIEDHLKMIVDNNLDGINVDYEENRRADWEIFISRFMVELAARLKNMNSNYQMTFCEPWEPRLYYELSTIPKIADYLMIMSYDEVWDRDSSYMYPTANQKPGKTIEGNVCCFRNLFVFETRNTEISIFKNFRNENILIYSSIGIAKFIQMGIPASKLVVGMPWYGYIFSCLNITSEGQCILPNRKFIAFKQSTFPKIYQEYITGGNYNLEEGWDEASLTPFLTITSKDKVPPVINQFWYENGTSLTSKTEMYKLFQLRGVGVFHVDCADYTLPALESLVKQFWDTYSVFED